MQPQLERIEVQATRPDDDEIHLLRGLVRAALLLGRRLYGMMRRAGLVELVVDVVGLPALEDSHGKHRAAEPSVPGWAAGYMDTYFYTRASTIYGGTTEIQKNIIAKGLLAS